MQVLRESGWGLFTTGGFSFMLNGCRQMWTIVLPIQGHMMGLSKLDIGGVIAVSRIMDAVMGVGVTGQIVDTLGRRMSGVPGMILISIAYYMTTVATDRWWLTVAAVIYGLGNGFTGGLTNTLSMDVCPEENKATFMGLFKMISSCGSLSAPLMYGILADVYDDTGLATRLVSVLALCAAVWLAFVTPDVKPAAKAPPLPRTCSADSTEEQRMTTQKSQFLTDV